jgi:hypothetical protein
MVEHHISCRPLIHLDAQTYCRFCSDHVNEGWAYFNFSNSWDMTEEELAQLNDRIRTSTKQYLGNGPAYLIELHRKETERLIAEGTMSGYVAYYKGRHSGVGRPPIFGYCNCGPKEKYKGMPDEWKNLTEPDGARIFAIMELLTPQNLNESGLQEKLITHALEQAKEQGFTHAQAFLWESGFVDKDGNNLFERFLALYTSMGFSVHADISDVHQRREYVLQKKL